MTADLRDEPGAVTPVAAEVDSAVLDMTCNGTADILDVQQVAAQRAALRPRVMRPTTRATTWTATARSA